LSLFFIGVVLCLFSALVCLVFIRRNNSVVRKTALWLTLAASLIFIFQAMRVVLTNQTLSYVLLPIAPQIQFSFLIDRLAAFFILIISIITISVSIYSLRYVEADTSGVRRNLFIPLMNFFILSMLFFVASGNSLGQLLFWELMSLTSFILVMYHYEKEETRKAGIFYFIMTQMSTVFLFLAFILMFNASGSFDLQNSPSLSPGWNTLIFIFLFCGFGIKAGIIPFHKWLPYAHSSSPSNISALMSGVMIKVAIYGLVRYVLFVLDPQLWWGILILVMGTLSALLGVVYALKEHDIKRLLAYHSIENIGIILIGFGLYIIFNAYGLSDLAFLSLAASLFHTLNHAIFKSLLFLTAGSVVEETGTRDIEKMGGLVKTMPFTTGLFLIGAISISALPPLNGFVSELMIFQAFFQAFAIPSPYVTILLIICLALFALTSALAAACFVKAFGIIFLAMPRSEKAQNAREVPKMMLIGPAILALLCVFLGIFSFQIFQWLGYPVPIPNLLWISLILIVFLILSVVFIRVLTGGKIRRADTWSCGLPAPDSQTEYTASGFSEPILTFFKPIYKTQKVMERNFWDKYHSVFKNGRGEIKVMKIFEEKLYLPVVRAVRFISDKVSSAQNVDLDTFILYSFITIIILIIIVGWML
jgi:hydrogenase-4 component B